MKNKTNKKTGKILTAMLALLLVASMLYMTGCSVLSHKPGSGTNTNNGSNTNSGSDTAPGTMIKDGERNIYGDGVIGERKSDGGSGISGVIDGIIGRIYGGKDKAVYDSEAIVGMPEPMPGEYYDGGVVYDPGDPYGSFNGQLKPGMLTAGEVKDAKDLGNWRSLWEDENWANIRKARGLFADNVIKVDTLPLAKVKLLDGETVADRHGNATLVYPDSYKGKVLTVKSAEFDAYEVTCEPGAKAELTVAVDFVPATPSNLDLMLMIDTTGSMGDELEYLKVEIKNVIERVCSEQNINVRLSVNFYRDEGDDYVVKYYDFRDDIDDCVRILGEQCSDGGGDYPEAVHTALGNVLQHSWREDSVKLCFFVLDAPPHDESEIQGINSGMRKDVAAISAAGIRIIPVVSSGADLSVESLMRSFAVMTGGTYIFLTNHSGIGGDHQTPSDTQYEVEPLNDCMVRVIKEYMYAE